MDIQIERYIMTVEAPANDKGVPTFDGEDNA